MMQAVSQCVELITWIAMRGALSGQVSKVTSAYQPPISNTSGAVMLLRNDAVAVRIAAE